MTVDDRLALLVAIHNAAGDGFASEAHIRIAFGFHRFPGETLTAALRKLHGEGLVIPSLRRGWAVTPDGWNEIVNPPARDLRPVMA
jgi:DNA-binding GntR family transcriptional regulator